MPDLTPKPKKPSLEKSIGEDLEIEQLELEPFPPNILEETLSSGDNKSPQVSEDAALMATLESAVNAVSDKEGAETLSSKVQCFTLRNTTTPNGLTLLAVETDGSDYPAGYILSLLKDGSVLLHAGINHTLGLQLDDNERIKVK